MPAHHPPEERFAAPECTAPALAVAVPELDLVADPVRRSPPEPSCLDAERRVEPDDRVRLAEHRVAELPFVVAVDHPAVGRACHRIENTLPELLLGRLTPVWPVMKRVQLDVGQVEPP